MTQPPILPGAPELPEPDRFEPYDANVIVDVDSMPDGALPEWWQWISGVLIPLGALATAVGVILALRAGNRDRRRFEEESKTRRSEEVAKAAEQARLMRVSGVVEADASKAPDEYQIGFTNESDASFYDVEARGALGYRVANTLFAGTPRGCTEFAELRPGGSGGFVLIQQNPFSQGPTATTPNVYIVYTDENGVRWSRRPGDKPVRYVEEVERASIDARTQRARLRDSWDAAKSAYSRGAAG